jgi:transcription elongation factor GreB
VTLEGEDGEQTEYRLVGPDEFDVAAGRISIESPMGRSLMGKEEGDEFVLRRPKGSATFSVVAIRYTSESGS